MRTLIVVCRLLVGFVFIFSSVVKGVDPLGTAYRLEDYFIAYGTEWAMPLALIMSVGLSTLEFVLGIAMIFNARLKQLSWILFIVMIFFTGLTLYDALYEPVPDCGCFGDAIKLSNWQTFYKNVVLIIFVSFIFFTRKKVVSLWTRKAQITLVLVAIVAFAWFSLYNLNHLPMIDFREYKVGNDLSPDTEQEIKIYLTYRNKENGEEKEYLSPDYPWNDSAWMSEWEFVSQRSVEPEGAFTVDLKIEDENDEDYSDYFMEYSDYLFMVVAWDLNKSDKEAFDKINELYDDAANDGYSLIALTSSLPNKVEEFRNELGIEFDFFYADDIVLKTMIRSNPGLILLKDGVILAKWHCNDIPDFYKIKSEFFTGSE